MEDFEDGQAQGWGNLVRPVWSFGQVEGHGTVLTAYVPDGKGHAYYRQGDFGNSVWLLDLQAGGGDLHLNWHFTESTAGISRYLVVYKPGEHVQIHRHIPGAGGVLAERVAPAVPEGVWQRIAIAYFEGAVDVWIDGQLVLGVNDPEPLERGGLWLEINPSPVSISFDDIVVCSLNGPYQP
jgi:hypothetical protein